MNFADGKKVVVLDLLERISLAVFVTFWAPTALAEDNETINAERPGFSSSPIALAPSLVQIEAGYQYTTDSSQIGVDDHTLPLILLRIGLVDRLEMQFSWAGISWTDVGGRHVNGGNDASIGLKWQVSDADATVPIALFAGLTLPVGDAEFSSDEADPSVGAFWSYSAGLDWFGTVIIGESGNDSSISNAVGISIPVDSDKGAYVEYFGNYAGDAGPEHYLNGGFTYLPQHNMQLDLHIGLGLNSGAADAFLGLGLAFRF